MVVVGGGSNSIGWSGPATPVPGPRNGRLASPGLVAGRGGAERADVGATGPRLGPAAVTGGASGESNSPMTRAVGGGGGNADSVGAGGALGAGVGLSNAASAISTARSASWPVLSGPVLSWPVLSGPALSWPVWSRPVLSRSGPISGATSCVAERCPVWNAARSSDILVQSDAATGCSSHVST